MKKNIICAFATLGLLSSSLLYADSSPGSFPPTSFASNSPSDYVVIENGNGVPIIILITVAGSAAIKSNGPTASGIEVKNCGSTSHINPGSTAICQSTDSSSPVTLSSDSNNMPATGTYQIKPQ